VDSVAFFFRDGPADEIVDANQGFWSGVGCDRADLNGCVLGASTCLGSSVGFWTCA
jgi:hypothetical protein